jgi:hypothetical protein
MPFLAVDGICGSRTNAAIACFQQAQFKIAPLKAAQRLADADSYATFAQECLADKPDKPRFVESRPGSLAGARRGVRRRSVFG